MTHQDHLFRIYDKNLKCWLTNCTVYQNGTYRGWSESMPPFPRYSKNANLHLMWRAPFKDKNGRWYFEGDLVKVWYSDIFTALTEGAPEKSFVGVVKIARGQFVIEDKDCDSYVELSSRPGSHEIIGNIYDREEHP